MPMKSFPDGDYLYDSDSNSLASVSVVGSISLLGYPGASICTNALLAFARTVFEDS